MPSKNTKKKIKKSMQNQTKQPEDKIKVVTAEDIAKMPDESESQTQVQETETSAELQVEETSKEEKSSGKKEDVKSKPKKEKKPSRIKKKTKEVFSELKKVSWPTFPQVMKKTATVIVVVLCFSVVLLGIDTVLELAHNWFYGIVN